MKNFLGRVLSTVVGIWVAIFLVLIFAFAIGGAVASKSTKTAKVEANSVLRLNLNQPILERSTEDPFQNIDFATFKPKNQIGLNDIIASIENAKENDNIKGIYLPLSNVQGGFATTTAIRDALVDFKTSGKFILGYGEVISQKAYYLGSVADELYVNPRGGVDFRGLATQLMFFKDALDQLDVDVQIFHKGQFKSAIEPFYRKEMSEPNRVQMEALLSDLNATMLQSISESRNISVDRLKAIAENLECQSAADAVNLKMVTATKYRDEVEAIVENKLGIDADDKISLVKPNQLLAANKEQAKLDRLLGTDHVAVLYATGGIVDGKGESNEIGSKRYVEAIKKLREDDNVSAVVFRINSGGGSALASDVILREIELTKQKKPFVVSFGDVAASGGYYIACKSDKIFAEPTTITGSIGVFGMIPNFENTFSNKMGITFDEVTTASNALMTPFKGLTTIQENAINNSIDSIYTIFKEHVSEGRELSMDEVQAIAQGRVWTGNDALRNGLVDEIGGLNEAIAEAKKLAELDDNTPTFNYPEQKEMIQVLLEDLQGNAKTKLIKEELGDFYAHYQLVKDIKSWSTYQARLPYNLVIE